MTPDVVPTTCPYQRHSRVTHLFVILVLVGLIGGLVWFLFFQTYHLVTVQEGVLYRNGNRGLREFKTALRQTGARTVVTLIDDGELADPEKSQFAHEATHCSRAGVRQERIAVKLGGWPTTDDVRKFLEICSDPTRRPVLVHCAQGVRRTGMFVAAYQLSVLGYDKERAKKELLTFGHSRRTVRDIELFIDELYDPAARAVTGTRPLSQE